MGTSHSDLYVVADHGGWNKKEKLRTALVQRGFPIIDLSPRRPNRGDDYPRWAAAAARRISRQPAARAILLCRTGVGMAMVANKFKNIRAVQGWSVAVAKRSRQDENTNVLAFAADWQSVANMIKITTVWFQTPFRPLARHRRRLRQMTQFERGR